MRRQLTLLLVFLLSVSFLIVACGDDDDDNDDNDAGDDDSTDDDDTSDDDNDTGDDDTTDDDTTDDDTGDDDTVDDDTVDDDTGDDDTADDDTDLEGYVEVSGGTFYMGSPEGELGRRDNEIRHEVTLTNDFEMKKTEVTQGQFEEVMNYNPSHFPLMGDDPNRPVEQVSWYDALAYANKTSAAAGYTECFTFSDILCVDETTGDTTTYCAEHGGIETANVILNGAATIYDCQGYRLPTEAEWEYAARGGTTTATYNGDIQNVSTRPLDATLDAIAWYGGNAGRTSHAVGGKEANDFGLWDMLGNVKEWTWDIFADPYLTEDTDPVGASEGRYHAVRGGAYWFHGGAYTRAAFRTGHTPGHRVFTLGFRLVRTLSASKAPRDFTIGVQTAVKAPQATQWPDELPWTFTRPAAGTPLTQQEIDDFTEKITGFWADTPYFQHYRYVSHGMDADNDEGWPEFKLYGMGSTAIKTGSLVEIRHTGNADNLMIPTGKVFNLFASLYLSTGDANAAYMLQQYCKGLIALFQGFIWSEDDPEIWVMPRANYLQNYYFEEEGGRQGYVNYDPVKVLKYDWNGWTIPVDTNPYYGSIWTRTMRSKDDMPHFYRMVPYLYRLIEDAPDQDVRDAAQMMLDAMVIWNQDIVNSGYYIHTKDETGDMFIPMNADNPNMVNDLASYVNYDPFIPDAECDPELAAALIGYGEPLGVDCGNGISVLYDTIATAQHYFNERNIIRYFHVDAVLLALMHEENDAAFDLLEGLVTRNEDAVTNMEERQLVNTDYKSDLASFLLASAATGYPLTDEEARLIVEEYSTSVDFHAAWPNWDLWDPSLPDGEYTLRPPQTISTEKKAIRNEEMGYLLEYCYSPFRNPAGAQVVDCEVILDPTQWGTTLD